MRIVFMGSPDFAVPCLQILLENGYDVVGVITAVDKPAGRGKKLKGTAVKKFAEEKGLNILQPPNLKSKKFLAKLAALKADLQVVVAFRMLPAAVFEMPPKGTMNLHASLLPDYRGAAPINWAIIDGKTKTGITTFFIEQEIDTGKILMQKEMPIAYNDDVGTLHDRMMVEGAQLVLETVQGLDKGTLTPRPQVLEGELSEAPKIFKENCEIDWDQPTDHAYDFIRGMSPFPTAFTFLLGKRVKIYRTEKMAPLEDMSPGDVATDNESFLYIATADGALNILELQLEGKRRMKIDDLLRGFSFEAPEVDEEE